MHPIQVKIMTATTDMLIKANSAKKSAALLDTQSKRDALVAIADRLQSNMSDILAANAADMRTAKGTMSDVMLDRLYLDAQRVNSMAQGVRAVAALPDPVGEVIEGFTRDDGLKIDKVRVPLGVVAIIYESRPNVTSDAAALCLMSGNVCVLRAGKEAHASAAAIVRAMKAGLVDCGADENLINLVEDTSRSSAEELMTASGFIDLLIPRGGAGLIKSCVRNAKVPVIQTGTGVCHIYVDGSADFDMALKIIVNAKCSRPSVCNAAEVCLVDRCIAAKFLPRLYDALVTERSQNKVGLLLDDGASALIGGRSFTSPAGEGDFDREFLDYKLAVGVVDGVNGAVAHILAHSTGHSDCIVTSSPQSASLFTRLVDSAAVYVNASTRFTDGGEFGLGCEMGISTQKLHARGPMGLSELTTYKYILTGIGNVR